MRRWWTASVSDYRCAAEETRGGGGAAAPEGGYHEAVLVREVVEALRPGPGKVMLDGTLGGGEHAEALLRAGARVVGIDQDAEALAYARSRLRVFGERFTALRGNARDFPRLLGEGWEAPAFDGILMDLGVSSRQLDAPERGFSFLREGPLAMTMDGEAGRGAEEAVNEWPEEELARVMREYGEEPAARRVARAIVARRAVRPFRTTTDLAEVIAGVAPRRGRNHPATRVFQAIRVAVNDELGALAEVLRHAVRWLRGGGRIAVISYHSLEDRMVKTFFRERSRLEIDRPEWPEPRPNPDRVFTLPLRKALCPGAEELARNPRARSARLRVAERLEPIPNH